MSGSTRGVHRAVKPKSRIGAFWEFGFIVVGALIISVLVRTFLVQAFFVPSGSMEQTLMPSDRIVASKISTQISGVHRGEVVVFADPGGWLGPVAQPAGASAWVRLSLQFIGVLPGDAAGHLVKRVIGIAGDHVKCCDANGRIVVNSASLVEPYLNPGVRSDQILFDVTVPPSSIFVLGDNRSESADSRYHLVQNSGSVPVSDVVGRVVAIIWPWDRLAILHVPAEFAAVPAAGK